MDNNFSDSEDETDNLVERTLDIPIDDSSEDEEYQQYIYSTLSKNIDKDINSYDLSENKSKKKLQKNNRKNNNSKEHNVLLDSIFKKDKEKDEPTKWMPSFLKKKSTMFTRKFNPRKPPRKKKEKINNKPTDSYELLNSDFPEL